MRADNAAMIIIKRIREADEQNLGITNKGTPLKVNTRIRDDASSEDKSSDDKPGTVSCIAANCTQVLMFLWAITNGMGAEVSSLFLHFCSFGLIIWCS